LSYATRRPENEAPERGDLAVLAEYFEAPHELIGPSKYRLTVEAIEKDTTLFYNFGENRKAQVTP